MASWTPVFPSWRRRRMRREQRKKKNQPNKKREPPCPRKVLGNKFKGTVVVRHNKGKQTDDSSSKWIPAWELVLLNWPQDSLRFCPSKLQLSLQHNQKTQGRDRHRQGPALSSSGNSISKLCSNCSTR